MSCEAQVIGHHYVLTVCGRCLKYPAATANHYSPLHCFCPPALGITVTADKWGLAREVLIGGYQGLRHRGRGREGIPQILDYLRAVQAILCWPSLDYLQ